MEINDAKFITKDDNDLRSVALWKKEPDIIGGEWVCDLGGIEPLEFIEVRLHDTRFNEDLMGLIEPGECREIDLIDLDQKILNVGKLVNI